MPGGSPITVRLQDLTVDVSLSGVARGDLLYRGASKWQNLAAGTSGHYLKSNGAGADPSWASVSVSPGGSSGEVQYNSSGSFAGAAALTYATSGSLVTVTAQAATDKPLVVKGASAQSANLTEWRNSSGTVLASISSTGIIQTGAPVYFRIDPNNGFINTYGTGWNGITLSSNPGNTLVLSGGGMPNVLITASASTLLPIAIRGVTSQTAALIQLQGQSSTTAGVAQAEVDTAWNDSTHASRSADLILRAYYTTTAREGLRIRGSSSDVQLGFYGVTPISRAVLATGAGATVDNVITALQNLGLVKQS